MRATKKKILLLVESSTSYGRDILQGISQYATERNHWWFNIEPRGISEGASALKRWHGDGIISRVVDRKSHVSIRRSGIPFVELLYNNHSEIRCSDKAIAAMAADYFLQLGFKNFAFFSFGGTGWIQDRKKAFALECKRLNLQCSLFNLPESDLDVSPEPAWNDNYEKDFIPWLTSLPLPCAVLTANDHQAIFLMNYCRELGIVIPDELAVLGVNNDVHLCNILSPSLSSIDQNAQRIGYEAARLLDRRMKNPDIPRVPVLTQPSRVITRKSTETLVVEDPDILHAIRFIREFAMQGIRVTDVLNEVQISNKSLERWFRKLFGHTPEKEIIKTKLRHAAELLTNTTYPTREIADMSGFSSEQYFVQVFRREMGITPSKFRLR
ncbi:MAG: XylR family transcriptional regulator [Planctomycetia bacterium]|nr:XylR family transcriptional regulator [Planctomycetia bacterium]